MHATWWWPWDGMRRKRIHLEPNVRCARDECDNSKTETDYEHCNTTRILTCSPSVLSRCTRCWVSCCASCWSCASCRQWCSCRCDRPLILYSKFLHISHRVNGSFDVLSLISHVPIIKLKLRYNCIDFWLFSVWWIVSSRFDTHLTPRLTREVCPTVLFHHDLIGSGWISESCKTGRHRLLIVFQHLWSHWHLYLLRDFITHSSCRQGRNHRSNWFLHCTRVQKHLICSSFWKFVCHQSPSVVLGSSSTCSVNSKIRQRHFLSWILDRTCEKLCVNHCPGANTLHQLVSLWMTRNSVSRPWSTGPRLKCTRVLQQHSDLENDTARLKLFQKAGSFLQRRRVCFYLCLSCGSCLSAFCCWYWRNCRTLLHLGLQQSFTWCPVLPQFLHMLISAELVLIVLVVRFPLDFVFAFTLPFTFLERVNLHPVIICTRSISRWSGRIHSKVSRRVTPLHQSCSKSGTVDVCTQLQNCSQEKSAPCSSSLCTWLHLPTPFQKRVPTLRRLAPKISDLIQNVPRGHTGLCKRHGLLHQGILSILSVWLVSTVYLSPRLSSVGFLHGSDQGSYMPFVIKANA